MSSAVANDVRLGIVCPMANEEASATAFIEDALAQTRTRAFKSVTFFVVIDLVSNDRTRELMEAHAERQPLLKVIWAPENACIVDAYVRGYRAAIDAGCDWIFEIDAGYSHRPADIPQFFDMMAKGYDCVFGSRFCPGGSMTESPLKRRAISKGGTMLANALLHTRLSDMTSGMELFSREALQYVLGRGSHVARPVLSDRDQDLLPSLPHCRSADCLPGAKPSHSPGGTGRFLQDPG